MSDRFVQAVRTADIADGGMKAAELDGREIVVCNCGGAFHAIDRRCGHMNAPLEQGSLVGPVLTCPLHYMQFDVTTGKALSNPIEKYLGEGLPPAVVRDQIVSKRLRWKIRIHDLKTWPVRVQGDAIEVDV